MEYGDKVAVIRSKCEEISSRFRHGLPVATDERGVPIHANNGEPLRKATAESIRQFVREIEATCQHTFPSFCAPKGTFVVDLSYLYVAERLALTDQRQQYASTMELTFRGSVSFPQFRTC